ncbi:hypothetical protein ND861_18990 [Leptospira sp. 2 VSF19]|uniref:Uncharacterized protein n=1 Tax=Leptospira soteropolitanensis TaxID=2950025 RepID=A0AAW5VHZ3_9LEPT|nr:hypothetical protein [Leptospira soteropolitanensis]MCW7494776.1 hypothetical protein [Leptospira soteropolitanensis]MCW7502357.1 hypothetical protein [Leptospira soteropolitanensis]MCW7524583.1 hypothetical protein [Leptospira soteropolitanensis]MCW7528451.1 hypothetical protein [Leptospira soteropolitanensis]MCW7532323.1 hypothetical protein [Leptospira soteropolitanensis]
MEYIDHLIYSFLALTSFFLINKIGEKMVTSDYEQISVSLPIDKAPAFNIVYRVLTPALLLILYAIILSQIGFDYLNRNIAFCNYYYIIIRIAIIFIYQRVFLVNWTRQFITYFGILSITYFLDRKYLSSATKILPEPSTLINELWIIILIFIYNLLNSITIKSEELRSRKERYILDTFQKLQNKFNIILNNSKAQFLVPEIYSIMIYENFNRPILFRSAESLFKKMGFPIKTTGIMQVASNSILSDVKSIQMSVTLLRNLLINKIQKTDFNDLAYYLENHKSLIDDTLSQYNKRSDYIYEIDFIRSTIYEKKLIPTSFEKYQIRLNRLIIRYLIRKKKEATELDYYGKKVNLNSLRKEYFKKRKK